MQRDAHAWPRSTSKLLEAATKKLKSMERPNLSLCMFLGLCSILQKGWPPLGN